VAESVESDMKLNSKLFIISLTTAIIFTFLILVTDHQNASAQTKNNKEISTEGKTAAPLVTFVEIGSINCIPCKAMQPIMKAVEEEYKGQVKIVFHDVWTAKGKADARIYNIRVIPTQVFLDKNGKEYFRHEGYFPKEEVVRVVKMQGVK
jgi:thioredoxin 1